MFDTKVGSFYFLLRTNEALYRKSKRGSLLCYMRGISSRHAKLQNLSQVRLSQESH